MVINVYEQHLIHRVEVASQKVEIKIVDTYITNTNDLFVIIYQRARKRAGNEDKNKFKIFIIDLDKSNIRENPNVNEHFQRENVGEYFDEDTDGRQLL